MAEKNNTENNLESQKHEDVEVQELDTASKSLSEALQMSFVILKVVMGLLIVVFLASGFRTVGSNEEALVLRFGKIRGVGENRLIGPGYHWLFPSPIDEIIKIPVKQKLDLSVDSFWYRETRRGPGESLDPLIDGYCITRNAKENQIAAGLISSDYNIVHSKWQLTYQIDDPERFFSNIYVDVDGLEPGQSYADIIEDSVSPLLTHMVESAVVTAIVHYSVDEAIRSQDRIPKHVKKLLQKNLDRIESGLKVVSVMLTDVTWPQQVNWSFLASIKASQLRQTMINEAESYAVNTLNEAGGPIAEELLADLNDKSINEDEKELLWLQLAGEGQAIIAEARAYRTRIAESTKANAEYMQRILPEYRKRPKLVIQKIYQDAMEEVFDNADEKMIIQPSFGSKGKEIRVLLNRDPSIKAKPKEEAK